MTHRAQLTLHLSAAGGINSGWRPSLPSESAFGWPVYDELAGDCVEKESFTCMELSLMRITVFILWCAVPVPQISSAVSSTVTMNVQSASNVIIDNAYRARLSTVDWCGPCIRCRDCHISHFNVAPKLLWRKEASGSAKVYAKTLRTPPANNHFRIFPNGVIRTLLTQVNSLGSLNTTAISLSPPLAIRSESEYVEAPISSAVRPNLWALRLKIRYPEIRRTGSLCKIIHDGAREQRDTALGDQNLRKNFAQFLSDELAGYRFDRENLISFGIWIRQNGCTEVFYHRFDRVRDPTSSFVAHPIFTATFVNMAHLEDRVTFGYCYDGVTALVPKKEYWYPACLRNHKSNFHAFFVPGRVAFFPVLPNERILRPSKVLNLMEESSDQPEEASYLLDTEAADQRQPTVIEHPDTHWAKTCPSVRRVRFVASPIRYSIDNEISMAVIFVALKLGCRLRLLNHIEMLIADVNRNKRFPDRTSYGLANNGHHMTSQNNAGSIGELNNGTDKWTEHSSHRENLEGFQMTAFPVAKQP
ncbi:hypothetical protein CLF_105327 [Clonorchis sinensis]|uniref:Uncharacterized protein n=1 Tax=Clonorchis sinensis TaxID=79923 RepID=G7YDE1_CLOSI|nr:hypothetical protein CLF_105327 [Clonorchis sinensis]